MMRLIFLWLILAIGCKKGSGGGGGGNNPPPNPTPVVSDMSCWMTKSDQSVLLTKQLSALNFGTIANPNPVIEVDSTQTFQTIDGFGYTLTGGSADLINGLSVTT